MAMMVTQLSVYSKTIKFFISITLMVGELNLNGYKK